ncbi:tannase/feruloyl esterase family alpha/beta hydrolase [Phenylobacterium sp.]|uniref:tannase/feruloyl esterase family alpha/beta hydrolase n=1 Tax=Phenylobacterium sp. TaxID=1871053 RepID=UPI00301E5E3A
MGLIGLATIAGLLLSIPGAAAAQVPKPLDRAACAGLAGFNIRAGMIGLPTLGASVTSAVVTPSSGSGPAAIPEHCLVTGEIRPVDPQAPNIEFKVALPIQWNGKVVMFGGGGTNGVIPNVTGGALNTDGAVTPLGRGYAVFGSDSGHQGPGASFALNREAHLNYLGDALKKTRDAAMFIVRKSYGRAATRAYFMGTSSGGREALVVAGRWPTDWDGVVSLYPARNTTVLDLGLVAANQVLAAPGAFPNPAKRTVAYRAALAACDGLDGIKDGIISNLAGCYGAFRLESSTLDGAPVRCPNGADTGDACLSDAQLLALRKLDGPVEFGYTLANGESSFPGANVLTSDSGTPASSQLSYGSAPPKGATPYPGMSILTALAWEWARHMVTRDASYNALELDVTKPGRFAERLQDLSAFDTADRDLTGFAKRGGKVLLLHGTDDLLISARLTERYYGQLKETLEPAALAEMVRYYQVPGFGHSRGATFVMAWDQLTALENWVEKGVDPANSQVGVDTVGVPGRTRPLCVYPTWPRYRGAGDVNKAASFSCATK